jgi:hypothetical protein
MSSIFKQSMWCLFLLIFGLTICTIQLFGWWTRQAQASSARIVIGTPSPTKRVQACETKHWRTMVMQQ